MRSVQELAGVPEPAWPDIQTAIAASPRPVEVLATTPERAESCLYGLQVTTRSWLGAVTFHTGGILVDDGWLRVLGSGSPDRGLLDVLSVTGEELPGVIVAQDVLGGQFSWQQGVSEAVPTVHYFGPDTLAWEDLGCGYADWLSSMLAGGTDQFFAELHWSGWRQEVRDCPPDYGIHTVPPPFTVEGADLGASSRGMVPMLELTSFYQHAAQVLNAPPGDETGAE